MNAPSRHDLEGINTPKARAINVRLIILLLLLIYSGLSAYAGNFLPLRMIRGSSMEPALHAGDLVLLRSVRFSEITIGDVIAYKAPEASSTQGLPATILHRVVRTDVKNGGRVLITQGDNSDLDPWPVNPSLVQGKMAYRLPLIGKPVVFLTSKNGIIFVSVTVLLSLLYIPAMLMFHATVLRKAPKPIGDNEVAANGREDTSSHQLIVAPQVEPPLDDEGRNIAYAEANSGERIRPYPYMRVNQFWHPANTSYGSKSSAYGDIDELDVLQYHVRQSIAGLSDLIQAEMSQDTDAREAIHEHSKNVSSGFTG